MKRGISMNRKMIYPLATVFLTGALITGTGLFGATFEA
jgi:hypothetical protein